MKRPKGFKDILDECLERVLVRGEDLTECLKSYPEYAAELKPLLQTALTVKKAAVVSPRPDFAARARYQFQLAVREAPAKKRPPFFIWQPVWATVLSVVLVFVITSSVTVAAASSMPGEALYPVKVATEEVRFALTPSPVGKAELSADLADRRVAEIVHLAWKGEPREAELELAIERLQSHLERIVALSKARKEVAVTGVPAPKATAKPGIREWPVPAPARAPVKPGEPSLTVPAPPPASVEPRGGEPGVSVLPKKERERLKLAIGRYAARHPEALREAWKKAPESVKPILRRAIIVSEEGYQKARQSLD